MKKIRDRVKLLKEAIREECNVEPEIDIHIYSTKEEHDPSELLANRIARSFSCLGGDIVQDSGKSANWLCNEGDVIANFTVFYERSSTSQAWIEKDE